MINRIFAYLKNHLSYVLFIYSIVVIVFGYGFAVGKYHVFPYQIIAKAKKGIFDWKKNYKHNLNIRPDKHIGKPLKPGRKSFTSKDTYGGVTLVSTLVENKQEWTPGLLLLDREGNIVHQWSIAPTKIFPKISGLDWDRLITGSVLLENGDVVFNINNIGIARMDWCSNIIWKKKLRTHHNIFVDEYGFIWTCLKRHSDSKVLNVQYPKGLRITALDRIVKLSPDGKLLDEIDIVDIFLSSELKGALFPTAQQHLYHRKYIHSSQITHLNDVEILGESIADRYTLFEAGDIMASLRNLNMVFVLDGDTHDIKWWMTGPFLRQHDPDFDGQGRISVFDNMGGGPQNDIGFASRIVSINPENKTFEVTYRAQPPEDFYTYERGNHQMLPNGNVLITSTFQGRIFEVDPEGRIVWQYVTKWDDEHVIHPYQAERYEDRFSTEDIMRCNE